MMILIALAAAAAAQPASALAPGTSEMQRVEVSYADLNLTNRAGVATLDRRIRGAARQICGGSTQGGVETLDVVGCRSDVVNTAQPQVTAAIERALSRRGQVSVEARLILKR